MNIGIIGFGNMGQAIVKGFLKKQIKHHIYVSGKNYEKLLLNAKRFDVNPCDSNEDVIKMADMLIIAVKPYQIDEVIKPLSHLMNGKIIVSIVASYTFDKYQSVLGDNHYVVTIPNTPISVGEGVLVCQDKHALNQKELKTFEEVFKPISDIFYVPENKLSITGTIAGCTPAFTAMYLESLGDAGVKYGLSRSEAYALCAKMLKGVGSMYLDNPKHPGMMKDEVCSPGGTTIKGVSALEKAGFRGTVISAIDTIEGK